MSERLTADISHDLRAFAQDMRAEHRNTDAGLLTEAADKLDGLIALLAQAETDRDEWKHRATELQPAAIHERESPRSENTRLRDLVRRYEGTDNDSTLTYLELEQERDRLALELYRAQDCGHDLEAFQRQAEELARLRERLEVAQTAYLAQAEDLAQARRERDRLREDWEYRGHQLDDAATVGRALIDERDRLADTVRQIRDAAQEWTTVTNDLNVHTLVAEILSILDAHLPEVGEPESNPGADDPIETDTKETTR